MRAQAPKGGKPRLTVVPNDLSPETHTWAIKRFRPESVLSAQRPEGGVDKASYLLPWPEELEGGQQRRGVSGQLDVAFATSF